MTTQQSPVRDVTLPHQIYLTWSNPNYNVRASCNCGWRGQPRPPQVEGTLRQHLDEYRQHEIDVA